MQEEVRFKECDRAPEGGRDADIICWAEKGRMSTLEGDWEEMDRGQLNERLIEPIDNREEG